jgi:hypothetical protein
MIQIPCPIWVELGLLQVSPLAVVLSMTKEGSRDSGKMRAQKSLMADDTSREELRAAFSYSIACLGD